MRAIEKSENANKKSHPCCLENGTPPLTIWIITQIDHKRKWDKANRIGSNKERTERYSAKTIRILNESCSWTT